MSHISKLLEDEISSLLDAVTIMIQDKKLHQSLPVHAVQFRLPFDIVLSVKNSFFSAKTADTLLLLLQISSW